MSTQLPIKFVGRRPEIQETTTPGPLIAHKVRIPLFRESAEPYVMPIVLEHRYEGNNYRATFGALLTGQRSIFGDCYLNPDDRRAMACLECEPELGVSEKKLEAAGVRKVIERIVAQLQPDDIPYEDGAPAIPLKSLKALIWAAVLPAKRLLIVNTAPCKEAITKYLMSLSALLARTVSKAVKKATKKAADQDVGGRTVDSLFGRAIRIIRQHVYNRGRTTAAFTVNEIRKVLEDKGLLAQIGCTWKNPSDCIRQALMSHTGRQVFKHSRLKASRRTGARPVYAYRLINVLSAGRKSSQPVQ